MSGQPIDHSSFQALRVERFDEVLRVTISHPTSPVNAVDDLLHGELTSLFSLLRRERSARAVVLTGAGRAFSAGGDFGWFPSLQSVERLHELRADAKQLIWDLVDIELPIVAAINGSAIGLGATIALLCDLIIASDAATFADPHVRVGIVAGDGGTAIWPLLVGPARAKEYLLSGDPLTSQEAERIGLINRVVAATELEEAALEAARRLAALPPLAVQYTKAAINKLVKEALNLSFDFAAGHELVTFLSEDHKEALAALADKREPRFRGR
ncbi:MAG TPA: enoyl-CoA hydratase/isomerase family protein [Acidimicrobiia bacterium]|nr:enoyl-CoA hydratase/isomerase family protein [Acidimicrobiia bacterium]